MCMCERGRKHISLGMKEAGRKPFTKVRERGRKPCSWVTKREEGTPGSGREEETLQIGVEEKEGNSAAGFGRKTKETMQLSVEE